MRKSSSDVNQRQYFKTVMISYSSKRQQQWISTCETSATSSAEVCRKKLSTKSGAKSLLRRVRLVIIHIHRKFIGEEEKRKIGIGHNGSGQLESKRAQGDWTIRLTNDPRNFVSIRFFCICVLKFDVNRSRSGATVQVTHTYYILRTMYHRDASQVKQTKLP